MNILVSACLLGVNCKYNGGNNYCEKVHKLMQKHNLIPFCPEVYGGLPTPRPPAEISGERVINNKGEDVTEYFKKGAEAALYTAKLFNCRGAVLKSNSPSCGFGAVYDGTFSGRLTRGSGLTAALLKENKIAVFDEYAELTDLTEE